MKNNHADYFDCNILPFCSTIMKKNMLTDNLLRDLFRIKTRKIPRPSSMEKANTENIHCAKDRT